MVTAICRTLITMNSSPKPRNRRVVDRSFMIRESSWPDCQRVWKLIGSRCIRAYRSVRIAVSVPSVARVTTQRRRNIRIASIAPSVVAKSPSAYRPRWSELAMGPSITALVASGTTMVAPIPMPARIADQMKRAR